jgi:hypothetical protein
MAGGDEIKFVRNGEEIHLGKVRHKMKSNKKNGEFKKDLTPIFDDIAKIGGNKNKIDTKEEKQLLNDLQNIFASDGNPEVSDEELQWAIGYKDSDQKVEDYIKSKIDEIKKASGNDQDKTVKNDNQKGQQAKTPVVPQNADPVAPKNDAPKPQNNGGQSADAYNKTIQNKAKTFDEDALKTELTNQIEIKKGDTLYKIAKEALKAEGVDNPNQKQINDRIAQIANLNHILNVNNVPIGQKIYVSKEQISTRPAVQNGEEQQVQNGEEQQVQNGQNQQVQNGQNQQVQNGEEQQVQNGQNQQVENGQSQQVQNGQEQQVQNADEQQGQGTANDVSGDGTVKKPTAPIVAKGDITVSKKPNLDGYTEGSKKDGDFEYKEHTKTEGTGDNQTTSTVYTYEIDGKTLYADSLDDLKNQVTAMNAPMKAPEPNGVDYSAEDGYINGNLTEDEDAKIPSDLSQITHVYTKGDGKNAERVYQIKVGDAIFSGANLEEVVSNYSKSWIANQKEKIEATHGNLDVIKDSIDVLINNVDLKTPEAQALVQDFIRTKDSEVVSELKNHHEFFANDEKAIETYAGLIQEIVAKENNGEKLSDEEVKLKEALGVGERYFVDNVYTDEDENNIRVLIDPRTGEINYDIDKNIQSKDKELLKKFQDDMKGIENLDGDEKTTKAQEIYKKYINEVSTKGDERFLSTLYSNDEPPMSRETKMELIKVAGASTLAEIDINEYKDDGVFNTAYISRAKDIYLSNDSKGDLKNLADASAIHTKILNMNKVPEFNDDGTIKTDADGKPTIVDNSATYKEDFAKDIATTYFTKGEGGKLSFNTSPRPTYEQMDCLAYLVRYMSLDTDTHNQMKDALLASIKVDDMGEGQFTAAIEKNFDVSQTYAVLTKDMSAEELIDFIENKMVNDKSGNIPFDSILNRFDAKPENKDLYTTLIKNADYDIGHYSFKNGEKLISMFMEENDLKLPDGVDISNVADAFPVEGGTEQYDETTKKAFKSAVKQITENDVSKLYLLRVKTESLDLKNVADNKFIELISDVTDGEILAQMSYDYPEVSLVLTHVDKNNIKTNAERLSEIIKSIPTLKYSDEEYQRVNENHWFEFDTLESAKGGKKSELYNFNGENYITEMDNDNKIIFKKVNKAGIKAGLDIFGYVDGANLGHNTNLFKTINNLTEDTVIDAIKEFNRQAGDSDHIMQWLANEVGPTKTDVNPIAIRLLKKAASSGLLNSPEYRKLYELLDDDEYFDYSESVARDIDAAMEALIKKIENPNVKN